MMQAVQGDLYMDQHLESSHTLEVDRTLDKNNQM